MPTRRQRQVAELLHEEISQLIQYHTQDPRLGFITVTGVEISPDLQRASVYVSVLGDDEDRAETLEGLTSAKKYFKYQLGQNLKLRRIPDLMFKIDHSLEYGLHIDNLLDQLKEEDQNSVENGAEENTSDPDRP